jgi:hypothetical protein
LASSSAAELSGGVTRPSKVSASTGFNEALVDSGAIQIRAAERLRREPQFVNRPEDVGGVDRDVSRGEGADEALIGAAAVEVGAFCVKAAKRGPM